jgi:hypothetical protein
MAHTRGIRTGKELSTTKIGEKVRHLSKQYDRSSIPAHFERLGTRRQGHSCDNVEGVLGVGNVGND